MTAGADRCFEAEWRALSIRLHAFLATKNVPAVERDDIVQEAGLRLFESWSRVQDDKPVWPLAVTIALNLVRDGARRAPREVLGRIPDLPGPDDVETAGLARVELTAVQRSLEQMHDSYRSALLAEIGGSRGRETARAHKMLRLRARRALRRLLEREQLGVGMAFARVRRSVELVQHGVVSPCASDSAAACLAVLVVVVGLGAASVFPEVREREKMRAQVEQTGTLAPERGHENDGDRGVFAAPSSTERVPTAPISRTGEGDGYDREGPALPALPGHEHSGFSFAESKVKQAIAQAADTLAADFVEPPQTSARSSNCSSLLSVVDGSTAFQAAPGNASAATSSPCTSA